MDFDVASFLRLTWHQIRHARGAGPLLLAAWQVASVPLVHLFMAIDELRHPEIRTVPVRSPLFVIGNPRSGTTLLLNLLAADRTNACHHTWELAVPSPTLRSLLSPRVHDWAAKVIARRFEILRDIHPVALDQPEEDELLFFLLGNSGLYQVLFPHGPELDDLALARFWEWPREKRDRFGRFLHACIQRLLWSRGATRYVSKSPHFSGKIDDLRRWYPDARFLHLVRSPLESIPSALSMSRAIWGQSLCGRAIPAGATEALYRTLVGLYERAHRCLPRVPPENVVELPYEELIASPGATVRRIYARFGFDVDAVFARHLTAADRSQARHHSRHRYDLAEFGLTEERIRRDLAFVFEYPALETRRRGAFGD